MPKIKFDRDIFNDFIYDHVLFNESRYLVCRGSAGSGKSVGAGAQKMIMRMVSERNHRFVLVRKFGNTIRKSQYKLLRDYIRNYNMNELFHFRDTDMTITCPSTSSEIIAVGVDEPEKIKSLADPTGIWYEEPTELTPQEFRQMSLRLRGEREFYKQEVLTFNPISETHWIRDEFFPPVIEDTLNKNWVEGKGGSATMVKYMKVGNKQIPFVSTMVHSTYMDNKFIDDEYKAILLDLKDKDPYFYQVYCLGQWGVMGELVFVKPWEILKKFPETFDHVMYGFDWGYHHPSTLVKIGIKDTEYFALEKMVINKTTREDIIKKIAEENLIEDRHDIVYYDSAEPELKEIFDKYGFDARPSLKGAQSVVAGIDFMKSVKIYSHVENLVLNKEQQTYKWAIDKDEKPIEGKVLKINDDCIDAVRYAMYTYSRLSEARVGFVV